MKTRKDISVIIPMYNAENYIQGTVTSVLEQEPHGFSFEIIIVNDCSTDRSTEIVRSIADERIVLLDLDCNVGLAEARNTGLRHANGEWIEFLDSDDRISRNLFRKFRESLDGTSNIYLFGLIIEYPEKNLKIEIRKLRDKRVLGFFGVVVKYFIRKELCISFEPGYLFEDLIFNLELMNKKSLNIGMINDGYYLYNRKNRNSIMSNFNAKEFERTFNLCYSRLNNYDRLTRIYFLETCLALLFDKSRPLGMRLKIALKTLTRLYPLLPPLMLNTLKNQLKVEILIADSESTSPDQ